MKLSTAKYRLFTLVLLSIIGMSEAEAAQPLSIKYAAYNKKAASLIVKTHVKDPGELLTLLHSKGGVLGQTKDAEHTFTIPMAELGEIPCQVEARVGELKISKAVAGAGAECSKVPVCKILKPVSNIKTHINQPTHFEAQFALKDKKAGPLTVEWDFAGGVMGHPYQKLLKNNKPIISGKVSADATFVRDNSRYHVRFMATDTQGRHCESGIYVDVGTPPTDLPDAAALEDMVEASQTNAPAKGSGLKIPAGEKVVLPYQDWTMQTASDARSLPDLVVAYGPQVNNVNATVYEKARKPRVVGGDEISLKYLAAANPSDPVSPNSINSTSQNWPVGEPLMSASIQKSDYFEVYQRGANEILADGYISFSFANFLTPELASVADEGYHNPNFNPPLNADHGRFMPGINNPYVANDSQDFSEYVAGDGRFAARMLPLTDIDDQGRVNPFPLFRIQAQESGSDTAIATTDVVINASRDLHCRECHAKGQMAAKPNTRQSAGAPFTYFDAASDSLFDQEYAAVKNMCLFHPKNAPHTNASGAVNFDGIQGCSTSCHATALTVAQFGATLPGWGVQLSEEVHQVHSNFQLNSNKDDVIRDANYGNQAMKIDGASRWDEHIATTSNSLFPMKDGDKMRAMEDNCLKCHGGKREQSYRDVMYTAGVTCYQCHGDVWAMGHAAKAYPSPDGRLMREPWLDEPDCGSCHTGNANRGKNGNVEFYSGGVRRLAFDKNDKTATPLQPDQNSPDEIRFAVPVTGTALYREGFGPALAQAPIYRQGKDNHGAVPCAACHGPAHGIWPNHDPKANDNVTAIQLQGHTGPIAECSVCHAADSFANFEDLDEGIRAADPKVGVLGGPHNMHPINDSNWWKGAAGDTANADGTTTGGWHNNYAKIEGRLGEDQCAACHGNDHLGTRLSKTPVDREFVTAKGKKISVKAGSVIGCNLCHTIEKSCTGSPARSDCGMASEKVTQAANRAPILTSAFEAKAVIGVDFHYTATANDPDGDPVTFQLADNINMEGITIDDQGIVTWPSRISAPDRTGYMGFYITAQDSQQNKTTRRVSVFSDCMDGLVWEGAGSGSCVKVAIGKSGFDGSNSGASYRSMVMAWQFSNAPLHYSLRDQPSGMTIDDQGQIQWNIPDNVSGVFKFSAIASNDQGDSAEQAFDLMVCASPQYWDQATRSCPGPVKITSRSSVLGMDTGQAYQYQVTATDDHQLPITYSLLNAPSGMVIDPVSGLISWQAQAAISGTVSFTVRAQTSEGGFDQKTDGVTVCAPPEYWGGKWTGCKGPIDFTSSPSINGVDVGQLYQYQAVASHSGGLKLTYSLGDYPVDPGNPYPPKPSDMSIDPETGMVSWLAQMPPPSDYFGSQVFYAVYVTDSNGYVTKNPQQVSFGICAPPTNWDNNLGTCRGPVRITSNPSVQGIDVGQTFTYQVIATDTNPDGMPITYSLSDAPATMSINAETGLITWVAEDLNDLGGVAYFTITATDKLGQQEQQYPNLYTCPAPQHWNPDGYCN